MEATKEYKLSYRDGYKAGRDYLWPDEWRTVYGTGNERSVRGHGTMHPAAAAGFMRGFRHGCIDSATTREP